MNLRKDHYRCVIHDPYVALRRDGGVSSSPTRRLPVSCGEGATIDGLPPFGDVVALVTSPWRQTRSADWNRTLVRLPGFLRVADHRSQCFAVTCVTVSEVVPPDVFENTIRTLGGGSLGSCVDEERSKLCELM